MTNEYRRDQQFMADAIAPEAAALRRELNARRRRNHRAYHAIGWLDGGGTFHPPRVDRNCMVCTGELAP